MPAYLIPGKIIVFLKVLPFVAVFFVLPGFFLRKILGRFSETIDGSIALDFSLGYSIFLIPGLITLYAMLSWTWLLAIWFAVLAVITAAWFVLCFNKENLKLPRLKGLLSFSWQTLFLILAGALLVFTFIILFLKGGHFIGDHQHHLAYIVKHLNTDILTPYVPMYKGTTEIPYNYAYEINYLVIAVMVKLTGVDLNLFWDISPALFFIISFSAYTLLYRKVMYKYDAKKFFFLFVLMFLLYELNNWDAKLDAEFMPIPDQFARTIFLPLMFVLFIDYNRNYEKAGFIRALPLFLILASIMFTHLHAYMAVIFIFSAYTVIDFCFNRNPVQKAKNITLYIPLMLFSIVLFVWRIKKSTFEYYSAEVAKLIDQYYLQIIIALVVLIFTVILARKLLLRFSELTVKRLFRILLISLFFFTVIFSVILAVKYYGYFMRSLTESKYKRFIETFHLTVFTKLGMVSTFILLLLYLKGMVKNVKTERFFFLFATVIVFIYLKVPTFNIAASKILTEVYPRRFLYLHEVYFIYIYLIIFNVIYNLLNSKLKFNTNNIINYVLILLFVPISVFLGKQMLLRFDAETYNRDYILQEYNVFDYIRENIEPWSVICSYNYAALDVVAQTPNYFISSSTVHSPRVQGEKERQNDTALIFKFHKNIDYVINLLKKYDATYILCEHNNDYIFAPKYSLEEFNQDISKYPEIFEKLFIDQKYILYKIHY